MDKYPEWRERCCDCEFLGLNSPEGIYCKRKIKTNKDYLYGKKLIFIIGNSKDFECKYYRKWYNKFAIN